MSGKRFYTWEEAVDWLIQQPDMRDLVKACYFDRPLKVAAERFWKSDEWQALRECFPSFIGKALDVGAGNGIASYALAKDGWKTVALEPDPSNKVGSGAIKQLSTETGVQIEVNENYGEQLPFDDDSFDLIHARQVLHHAHDLPLFCKELFRVLRPGGRLVATREHVISSPAQLPHFYERHPLHNLYGGENAFTLKKYKGCLKDAGFRVAEVIGPFDSIINFAPYSRKTLVEELQRLVAGVPGGALIGRICFSARICNYSLRLLSVLDCRPGRLYSFIANKPWKEAR